MNTIKYLEIDSDHRQTQYTPYKFETNFETLGFTESSFKPGLYSVKLLELIIPKSSSIVFKSYSYVYIVLENSTKSVDTGFFISNNLSNKGKRFRVSLTSSSSNDDTYNKFSCEMSQIINLSLRDDIKFEIALPDGTTAISDKVTRSGETSSVSAAGFGSTTITLINEADISSQFVVGDLIEFSNPTSVPDGGLPTGVYTINSITVIDATSSSMVISPGINAIIMHNYVIENISYKKEIISAFFELTPFIQSIEDIKQSRPKQFISLLDEDKSVDSTALKTLQPATTFKTIQY